MNDHEQRLRNELSQTLTPHDALAADIATLLADFDAARTGRDALIHDIEAYVARDSEHIAERDALAAKLARAEGLLRELLAATDASVKGDDDVAAMLRFGEADAGARAYFAEQEGTE